MVISDRGKTEMERLKMFVENVQVRKYQSVKYVAMLTLTLEDGNDI